MTDHEEKDSALVDGSTEPGVTEFGTELSELLNRHTQKVPLIWIVSLLAQQTGQLCENMVLQGIDSVWLAQHVGGNVQFGQEMVREAAIRKGSIHATKGSA